MITVSTKVKMGAVNRTVEVVLYNTQDVARELGITNVAVVVAAGKMGVGIKDAGSMFFTVEDIATLRLRPGRGRPLGSVKQEVVHPENVIDVPVGMTDPSEGGEDLEVVNEL